MRPFPKFVWISEHMVEVLENQDAFVSCNPDQEMNRGKMILGLEFQWIMNHSMDSEMYHLKIQ